MPDHTGSSWAVAKAYWLDALLFGALAKAVQPRLGKFNLQDLANTGGSVAMAHQLDALLFTALARAAQRRLAVGEVNAHRLANIAWAFATAD